MNNAVRGIPNLWFSSANCAILTTNNVAARSRNKLRQPTNCSNKETNVDKEENYCWVSVQRFPIKYERQLQQVVNSKHKGVTS